jgi:NifU-like protein
VHPAVADRLAHLAPQGSFAEEEARERGCRLVATEHGAAGAADHIALALLVGADGRVADARYRTPAQGELLAAYDAMAELCVGRAMAEVAAISPRAVEGFLRGGAAGEPALPLAGDADAPFYVLRKAHERWLGATGAAGARPFAEAGLFEKVKRIEAVLDQYVRPALAADGGGLDLVDLKGDELTVQYQGACGSCSSSVGGTLTFVQDALANHLGHPLTVRVSGLELEERPFAI